MRSLTLTSVSADGGTVQLACGSVDFSCTFDQLVVQEDSWKPTQERVGCLVLRMA